MEDNLKLKSKFYEEVININKQIAVSLDIKL